MTFIEFKESWLQEPKHTEEKVNLCKSFTRYLVRI
jgi:hypothetical protein